MNRVNRRLWLRGGLAVAGLSLLSGCGLVPFPASPPSHVARIGWLSPVNGPGSREFEAVRQGLRELGYVEGQTVTIDSRLTDGRNERIAGLAAELVNLGVDVIVTDGLAAAAAARDATRTIPIVMGIITDPIGSGLVTSLNRPGGNITGFASLGEGIQAKRVQLFTEAIPHLSRVAVLHDPTVPASVLAETQSAAVSFGLELLVFPTRTPDDLEHALAAASDARADGLTSTGGPLHAQFRKRIAGLALEHRLPTIFGDGDYAVDGGLLAFGPNVPDIFRRSASYIDRVLKGANPGELPIQQPTKFDFVINLGTAHALGLTIAPAALAQATEAIQ
jgi:putative tryptophan/tyrosine transport system substrate-binding protein